MATTGLRPTIMDLQLFFRAYRELLWLELQLRGRGFAAVHEAVKTLRPGDSDPRPDAYEEVCRAVDIACVFYFKEVQCLQRSAATARLLRRRGIYAELVIGVQQWPFRAHAWVEIAGRVVNDKPHITEGFAVIDRC
jgi:hypothetical protein